MEKRRRLPTNLKAQAAGRSNSAIDALNNAMAAIEARLEQSGYDRAEPLNIKEVQEEAGLNAKFLYGPKHKDSTKVNVEEFVARINAEWEKRQKGVRELTELDFAKENAAYWQDRYNKLATHAHIWFRRMRQQQRQIRDQSETIRELKAAAGRVVSLVPKD